MITTLNEFRKINENIENNYTLSFQLEEDPSNPRRDLCIYNVHHNGNVYNVGTEVVINGRDRDSFTITWDHNQLSKLLGKNFKADMYPTRTVYSGTPESDWYYAHERLEYDLKQLGTLTIQNL